MKLLIIHLSDLHLKSGDNIVLSKKEMLYNAVRNICLDMDILFLVITGDIGYSGKNDEYVQAMDLIEYLKTSIGNYTKKILAIVMIPGNHDCDHEQSKKSIRDALIKQIRNDEIVPDAEIIDQCCEVQRAWYSFNQCYSDEKKLMHDDKLLKIHNYELGNNNVIFYCYNTSWISQEHEEPGLLFPLKPYLSTKFKTKADLVISLFHHPFIWQNPHRYRDFMNHIENTSDIVLTGHEHITSNTKKDDLQGNITEYFEGGILQDHNDHDKSDFNIIQINTTEQLHKMTHFTWDGKIYSAEGDNDWIPYQRYRNLNKKNFDLKKDFNEFIVDAGAPFKHPRQENLTLEDFFIFPNLKDLNEKRISEGSALHGVISSRILIDLKQNDMKVILMGAEKIGKTALCRTLFKHYFESKHIPILIEGHAIKDSSPEEILKLINKNFKAQYLDDKFEDFKQSGSAEKIIIIDDLDKSRLNMQHKSIFLSNVNKYFTRIIVTTNDLFPVEEIMCKNPEDETYIGDYSQYKIMDFGYQLRNDLINKWNLIGREHYIDKVELLKENDKAEKVMDAIIGHNYVPSLPIYLLILLNAIDEGQPNNLKESSYGRYYEYLITQTLIKLKIDREELDGYYNYITELAFNLFERKTREISDQDLQDFYRNFCTYYRITQGFPSFEKITDDIIKASILSGNKDTIRFRYKYVFYYFVARYLSNNISEVKIKNIITELCKRLHIDEFSSIILFLTYHSKDPFVLNEILANAKKIFSEFEIVKFDKDTSFVNNLLNEVPKLVYQELDVEKNRQERAKRKDEKRLQRKQADDIENLEIYDYEEKINELKLMSKINLASKTIEIIGQILKNYFASLNGARKLQLGEEAYFIGLRALKSFYSYLNEDMDNLVKAFKTIIEGRKIDDRDEVEKVASYLLFQLCGMISLSFISKTAQALGSEKLAGTFKDILGKNNFASAQLIDIAIKLDFYHSIPYDDLKKLKSDFSNNYLPLSLLNYLVINYLYMFPTKYDEKQKICSIMGIPVETTRLIDVSTTQRKKAT